ncbi:MAG: TIGR02996 domain-containing protein [Polyangiales bacterium]
MSRESDALAEVLAAPDDDVPRMAYADLLVAKGDLRGEFIRTQCALTNGDVEYLEKKELRERAARLLAANEKSWRAEAGLTDSIEVEWRRGFVDTVSLTGEQFAGELGAALFDREPVRHAKLRINSARVAKKVAQCPHVARISALTVYGTLSSDGVAALLEAPLNGLKGLNVGGIVDGDSLPILLQCDALGSLERLSLSGCELQGSLAEHLPEGCALLALQTLFAARCGLDDDDLIGLADSPLLSQLVTLCITNNEYGVKGLRALGNSPNSATLQSVEIDLVDEGTMQALLDATALDSLRRVMIAGYEWKLPKELRAKLRKRFGKGLRWT